MNNVLYTIFIFTALYKKSKPSGLLGRGFILICGSLRGLVSVLRFGQKQVWDCGLGMCVHTRWGVINLLEFVIIILVGNLSITAAFLCILSTEFLRASHGFHILTGALSSRGTTQLACQPAESSCQNTARIYELSTWLTSSRDWSDQSRLPYRVINTWVLVSWAQCAVMF